MRILFIGNSYTYFHNLPDVLAALAAGASPSRQLHVAMEVLGGATLQQHWMRGTALARIEDGTWDVVVLQEQSMLGVHLVDGAPAINAPRLFHRYARLFDRAIRRAGARTVLYSTWRRREAPAAHQAALDDAYLTLGRSIGADVAPVGDAWQRVRSGRPSLELYEPDGSHPSAAGTYLAATVLWGTISGTPPIAFPSRARGRAIRDLGTGSGLEDTLSTLVDLPAEVAQYLQSRAAEALRQPSPSSSPTPAPLPADSAHGEAPALDALPGTWTGTMRLYDAPVEVTLRITSAGGTLRATWTEHYPRGAGSLTTSLADLRVEGGVLRFTIADPRFLTPPIRHQGVWRAGELVGVAEVGTEEQLPHLLGHWTLQRRAPDADDRRRPTDLPLP